MMISLMAAVVLAAAPVTLEFDGTLKDGLKQLAQKSGLNLVVIGEFDEKVNLNFPGVNGEEALETIAQAYGLEVTRSGKAADGKMWVIRRAAAPAVPVAAPLVTLNGVSPDSARQAAEQARVAADRMREQADQLRQKADAMRGTKEELREKVREQADVMREKADAMREQADEMREAVEDAREQAREAVQEAREQAREQAQEAAEAAREAAQEQAEAMREQGQAQADLSQAQAELARHRVSTGAPVTVEKGSHVDTAVAYGGPVIVEENAVVDGDAVAFGGDVVLKKGAIVEGDAVSFGGNVVREEGSQVHGESVSMGGAGIGTAVARNVLKTQRSQRVNQAEAADDDSDHGFGRGLAMFLLEFAALFGLGFVMMMFAPQRMKALEATIRAEPGKNGLAGVLGLMAAVPLALMLTITLVGIPLVMVALPAAIFLVIVGLSAVANAIGSKLPTGKLRKTQALVLAVGLLAMLLVFQVPVFGWMLFFVAAFISLGAIIRTRFGQGPRSTPMLDPMHTAPSI
ncbi:MAG: hypothetical protein Q8N23_23390 [Archangium sp.]|nr:hypothetical protein [Archangium sp.]MDP3570758.1 hypothetical protein [Archangium sp.]